MGTSGYLGCSPGKRSETDEQGWISLVLCAKGKVNRSHLETVYRIAAKDATGEIVKEIHRDCVFQPRMSCGFKFMKRDEILDPNNNILKDGALCIDVTIQVKDEKDDHYKHESKLSKIMMNLLESGDGADKSFKVGSSTFPVHSHILRNNAPMLANHLDREEGKVNLIVSIEDIPATVFKMVLAFVYAEHSPTDKEVLEHGKDLINAANRYELSDLKMAVEHTLVRERILTTKNVSDYILFADAQSCPLLKEYAISFLRLNATEVLKSKYSECLKKSGDLLAEVVMLSNKTEDEDTLTVNELRKELSKRKLDVDGTKETLLLRLEEAKRQRTEY